MTTGPLPTIVTTEMNLKLVLTAERSVTVLALFDYAAHEPFSVRATFRTSEGDVNWVFARDLLAEGLRKPVGDGDIAVWPSKNASGDIFCLSLSSPSGQALMEAPREQIEEFLMQFNGEGIQHIALLCDDLVAAVDRLQMAGVPLMTAPNEVYYEMLGERLPGHGEPVAELKTRGILLDGSTANGEKRLLLQIFSETLLGPVFFEFIQRKADEGFGEGNFKALFESLERDQVRRGAIKVDA